MKKIVIFLVFLLTPFVLLFLLKAIYPLLSSYKDIGSIDGWLGFLGGYTGGIIAIAGIWWQLSESKKREDKNKKDGLINYLRYIIDKNIEADKDKKIKYTIQSLSSYTSTNTLSEYKPLYAFDKDFFSENIKTIMELSSDNSHIGTKILNLNSDINELNEKINFIYKNLRTKSSLLINLENFIKNIPETDKFFANATNGTPFIKNTALSALETIKNLSQIVTKYNDYLDNIKNNERNHTNFVTKRISNINDILKKTFYKKEFKDELSAFLKKDFIKENSKDISKELNKFLMQSIDFFINEIQSQLIFHNSDKLNEFEVIYINFQEFLFTEPTLNGKIFDVFEIAETLKKELDKIKF